MVTYFFFRKMKFVLILLCCVLSYVHADSEVTIKPFRRSFFGKSPQHSRRTVDAPNNHAPYQCSIQVVRKHICGCAILSEEYIVTAAECFDGQDAADVEVMVGSNNISDGKYYILETIIQHERYDKDKSLHNIAIAKINGKIEFDERIIPIKISRTIPKEGSQIEITGWGIIGPRLPNPTHLQLTKSKVLNTATCKQFAKEDDFYRDDHFCAIKRENENFCKGDEGNPVVLRIVTDTLCGSGDNQPNPLVKISNHFNWLRSKTGISGE